MAGLGPRHLYRILWDYSARNGDELSVVKGELVAATLAPEAFWLIATNRQGKRGLIPENYVALVKTAPKERKQQVGAHSSNGGSTSVAHDSENAPKQQLSSGAASSAAHGAEDASKQKLASDRTGIASSASKDSEKLSELPPKMDKSMLLKTPSILQIEDWEDKISKIRVVLSFVN